MPTISVVPSSPKSSGVGACCDQLFDTETSSQRPCDPQPLAHQPRKKVTQRVAGQGKDLSTTTIGGCFSKFFSMACATASHSRLILGSSSGLARLQSAWHCWSSQAARLARSASVGKRFPPSNKPPNRRTKKPCGSYLDVPTGRVRIRSKGARTASRVVTGCTTNNAIKPFMSFRPHAILSSPYLSAWQAAEPIRKEDADKAYVGNRQKYGFLKPALATTYYRERNAPARWTSCSNLPCTAFRCVLQKAAVFTI